MTSSSAHRLALGAAAAAAGGSTLRSLSAGEGLPPVTTYLGAAVAGTLLAALGSFAPEVGGRLAAVVLVTVLLTVVPWDALQRLTSR